MKTQKKDIFPRLGAIAQRLSRLLIILGFCVAVPHLAAWGQIDTGSLVGAVKDASGALVANATVTVRDEATGLTLSQGVSSGRQHNFTAFKGRYVYHLGDCSRI